MPEKKENKEKEDKEKKDKADIKKEYGVLAKKYDLPPFGEFDNDFEISEIDDNKFLLRKVRGKIEEKMEGAVKILTSILQPEQNISDLHECRTFSEKKKKEIYELYRKIMIFKRNADILSFSSSDDEEAGFLKAFYEPYTKEIKPQLKKIIGSLKDSWKEDTDISEKMSYLG